MIFSTLGRLIWVPIAFGLSGVVAGFVLLTLGLERFTGVVHGRRVAVGGEPLKGDLAAQRL